jgi:hypothetical protein
LAANLRCFGLELERTERSKRARTPSLVQAFLALAGLFHLVCRQV